MATRRRLGTGPVPTTRLSPGRVPRLLAAERATDTDPHDNGDGDHKHAVAEAWAAAGRRRLGLDGAHNDQ